MLYTGDVTFGDLSYAIPFGDYLVVVEMRGKHVLEMLEHSAAGLEPGVGGYEFLHVSGNNNSPWVISNTQNASKIAGRNTNETVRISFINRTKNLNPNFERRSHAGFM